jgi:hypothetical protein
MEGVDDIVRRRHQKRSTALLGTGKVNCHEREESGDQLLW